jgi:hypothetical protein
LSEKKPKRVAPKKDERALPEDPNRNPGEMASDVDPLVLEDESAWHDEVEAIVRANNPQLAKALDKVNAALARVRNGGAKGPGPR